MRRPLSSPPSTSTLTPAWSRRRGTWGWSLKGLTVYTQEGGFTYYRDLYLTTPNMFVKGSGKGEGPWFPRRAPSGAWVFDPIPNGVLTWQGKGYDHGEGQAKGKGEGNDHGVGQAKGTGGGYDHGKGYDHDEVIEV